MNKHRNFFHAESFLVFTEMKTVYVPTRAQTRQAFSEEKTFWIHPNEKIIEFIRWTNTAISSIQRVFKSSPKWKLSDPLHETEPARPFPKKGSLESTPTKKPQKFIRWVNVRTSSTRRLFWSPPKWKPYMPLMRVHPQNLLRRKNFLDMLKRENSSVYSWVTIWTSSMIWPLWPSP